MEQQASRRYRVGDETKNGPTLIRDVLSQPQSSGTLVRKNSNPSKAEENEQNPSNRECLNGVKKQKKI